MAELPFFPLDTGAFLSDTTHMSPEELGAYTRILLVMWRHGAKLPADDKELSRIAGITRARWGRIREKVTRPLSYENGFWTQKRLTETWRRVQEIRAKRALAGQARWRKR